MHDKIGRPPASLLRLRGYRYIEGVDDPSWQWWHGTDPGWSRSRDWATPPKYTFSLELGQRIIRRTTKLIQFGRPWTALSVDVSGLDEDAYIQRTGDFCYILSGVLAWREGLHPRSEAALNDHLSSWCEHPWFDVREETSPHLWAAKARCVILESDPGREFTLIVAGRSEMTAGLWEQICESSWTEQRISR